MCGIAGYFSENNHFSEDTLQYFIKCQNHRGPDASGTFQRNVIELAHNRLSILDTSNK